MMAEFTRDVGKPIGALGGAFMLHPETGQRGDAVGLDFLSFYALGRGGVLGNVDAEVVIEAFYFFEPAFVKGVWETARGKMEPSVAVRHYADACAAWGRDRFSQIDGLDAFCDLAERVVAAAEPTPSSALFAGWRRVPLADDATGRAAQQLMLQLRELRGGAHVEAVKQVGLTPREGVATNSPHMFQLFGWQGDPPDIEPLRERAAKAEDITDELVRPAFETLNSSERETFASIVEACSKAAGL
jgi:hypothetical protein